MAKLIFPEKNKEFDVPDGSTIQKQCEEVGITFACAGEGICGSCTVKVLEGKENLSAPTQAEKDFFGDMGDQRLACQCTIEKGTVKLSF